MKKMITLAVVVSLGLFFVNCGKGEEPAGAKSGNLSEVKVETVKEKESYAMGFNTGKNMQNLLELVEFEVFLKGLKDAVKDNKPPMELTELSQHVNDLFQKVQKAQAEKRAKIGLLNKTEGEKFLAENKDKQGVKTTKSGLQYTMITEGTGKKPVAKDRVKVQYKGTFINGVEFDSSFRRGTPAEFYVDGVIKGWTEGLQLMNAGAKYRFFIPSELAYGKRGIGNIGPNAVLIFDVELLEILPKVKKEEQK